MKTFHFVIEVEPTQGDLAAFCEAVHAATLGEGTPAVHDDVFTVRFGRDSGTIGGAVGEAIDDLVLGGFTFRQARMEAGR